MSLPKQFVSFMGVTGLKDRSLNMPIWVCVSTDGFGRTQIYNKLTLDQALEKAEDRSYVKHMIALEFVTKEAIPIKIVSDKES